MILQIDDYINTVALGDCEPTLAAFPDESIDLICTDPPYGIAYKSNWNNYHNKLNNDSVIPLEWLEDAYRILKQDSAMYVFCSWHNFGELKNYAFDVGFNIKNMIVLWKSNAGMGDLYGQYAPKHELILYATKGRHILKTPKRIADVWAVPVLFTRAFRFHPTEKPYQWIYNCVHNSSRVNDIVLDPFAGSGTLGLVCKDLNRRFILIENDPIHYQTCLERLNNANLP